jgi:NAD(P)-dependent dehydrogenase (short-subunit alcohol dehydrogenase family)
VRAFAREGDDVHILGRREPVITEATAEINEETGREAIHPHPVDLTDVASIEALLPQLPGEIDVLVN